MLVISSPIGPVSYPVIAAKMKRNDFQIEFDSKEGDIKLDAIPLLQKTNYVLVKKMLIITPKIGNRIAVWKKGSANDILLNSILKLYGIKSQIIYTDDPSKVYVLYKEGKVDSALVTTAVSKQGLYIEDLLKEKGFELPGICGADIIKENLADDFYSIYNEGIDLFKENIEEASEYVAEYLADNLSVYRSSLFIQSIFESSEFMISKLNPPYIFRKIFFNLL
ncbi:DUF3834 domain-containing protein [Acidianus sulfidivorans JP7]|uniref:DUF3834 domain-containing protein n=1 Tax=Acidianus sulfidivorans JP7 TaxID=619593 RepID=A0A2U9IK27_9CREN|nr:DUF3834 domain-containing protein [Acidianus sulfidivorans]AWR96391.1 DUF3834 domain-containing protein [Acidianus sulfidivorans JP7]